MADRATPGPNGEAATGASSAPDPGPTPTPAPPPPGGWRTTAPTAVAELKSPGQPPQTPPGAPPSSGHGPGGGAGGGRPRGVVVGVVLVVAGALLLFANVFPGVRFVEFWPAIIVALGIVQAFTRGHEGGPRINRVFDGITTIVIGSLLLACSTGTLSWSIWWSVLSLWPVLLISAGLGIFGRGVGARWLGAVGTALVIAALLYGAFVMPVNRAGLPFGFGWRTGSEPFEYTAPTTASSGPASLVFKGGTGDLTVKAGRGLLSATGTAPEGQPPVFKTSGSKVTITGAEGQAVYPGAEGLDLKLALGKAYVWDLAFDTGMQTLDADLSELDVSEVTVDTGLTSAKLKLGEPVGSGASSGSSAVVDTGVSDITISVPEDADVELKVDTGLTGVDVDEGFEKSGDGTWRAEGTSAGSWIVKVASGVGAVTVKRY